MKKQLTRTFQELISTFVNITQLKHKKFVENLRILKQKSDILD